MTSKLRIDLEKLGVIVLTWVIVGFVISVYDHFMLMSNNSLGFSEAYTFGRITFFNIVAALLGSFMGGSVLVFYVNKKFREKPYWYTILMVFIFFVIIVTIITLTITSVLVIVQTGKPLTDPESQMRLKESLLNPMHLSNTLIWSIVVGLTQLLLQINEKFGQGVLWNIIKGKYHSPKEETRIFMFVDIRSSTTIAEKIGNKKYYGFLKDFYADITDAIIYNKGEIYQYVGDEVVVSWMLDRGTENNQCLKCYFEMKETIEQLKDKYISKYGLIPEFKAALHYGKVIAGEIGIIKRDITYSGDILNTAARIQGQCNKYGVNLLASNVLINHLKIEGLFKREQLGAIELRGKEEKVELSTLVKL